MAINLVGASLQFLENTAPPTFAFPITIAAWLRPADSTTGQAAVSLSTSAGTARLQLACAGNVAGDPIRAASFNSAGTNQVASTTSGYTTSGWHHGCAVFTSTTSRTAYIDGGNSATNTTANDPSIGSINRIRIGNAINAGTNAAHYTGGVADVGIWSVALDADEVAALAKGVCPLLIRPSALIAYYPLTDLTSPSIDPRGRYEVTHNNSPTLDTTSPRLLRPSAQILQFPSASGGSVESGAGSPAGAATVSGVGASTAASTGTVAGTATVAAVGASTAAAVGSAAGTSTVSGVSPGGSTESGDGTAAGTSTASAVGASTAASVGTVAGAATVSGVGEAVQTISATGTAAGTSTASAVGADAATETETDSPAGLRVHAAREASFFFSSKPTRRRSSRPSWPVLRAA